MHGAADAGNRRRRTGLGIELDGAVAVAGPRQVAGPSRPRDARLDLARGLAMIIILIAHIPANRWALWIPARFGPSDAADVFVLCSGIATGIAFGGTFERAGWVLGTARVLSRIWQIYWANLGLFLVTVGLVLWAQAEWPVDGRDWVAENGLTPLLDAPAVALVAVVTLQWVPPYFEILPVYMVALALVPLVVALATLDRRLAAALVLGLYLAGRAGLNLPGSPFEPGVGWGFNPFAWQLLFFIGFAFGRGWLVVPPLHPWLVRLALAWVILWIPLSHWAIVPRLEALQALYDWLLAPAAFKADEHPIRILHVLAVGCLALAAVERWPWLLEQGWARRVAAIGQQALASFLASMLLARVLGFALDHGDRGLLLEAVANLAGIAAMAGVAALVGWLKAEPWQRAARSAPRRAPVPGPVGVGPGPRPDDQRVALEAQGGR
jgi:hypothetical protein